MPLIVFTYTAGALSKEKAINVSEQIRESLIRNYAIKTIPDGLRMHTRIKIVETPPDTYFVLANDQSLPLYDVELVGPIASVTGADADNFAREVTTAILTAEGVPVNDENSERVWCVFTEVPDQGWTIGRKVMSRRNVLRHILRYQSRNAKSPMRHAAE